MSHAIKLVMFDQGGVLTRGGGAGTNDRAASQVMDLSNLIEVPDLFDLLKRGQISNAQFVEEVNERYPEAPHPLTDEMWEAVYASLTKGRQQAAYDFAAKCRKSGYGVGLLSNIGPVIASKLKQDGSYDGFDPLILSCEVGYAKPDPKIYELVEDHFSPRLNPEQILLVDDQQKCVDGATKRGWHAVLVKDTSQMIKEVSELLGLS